MRFLAALGFALALASAARADDPAPPHFVDVTAASGLKASYDGEWQYMVGGGAAAFDCAHDGRPSLLIAGGESKAKFFRNVSKPGGAIRFEEQPSGLEFDRVVGAYPIDIDGDGEVDLVVLRVGEIDLMRGLGNCRFARANEAWGFQSQDAWWTSFSATWEKGQAWPTLAFGSYVDRTKDEPWGTCTQNLLYRPASENGAPQRRFAAPLPLAPSFCPLSMLFTDWNRSGTPSLRVSNDREYYEGGQEQMWRIAPGEPPRLYTEAEGWKYLRIWGMGIASYDLSGSGFPDYYLTSMADQKLQRLDKPAAGPPQKPSFSDIAFPKPDEPEPKGTARQSGHTSPSAFRAFLDVRPIHIRPNRSRQHGCRSTNPMGSSRYGGRENIKLISSRHGILRTNCEESTDKGLKVSRPRAPMRAAT